jgi:hypothetical protein
MIEIGQLRQVSPNLFVANNSQYIYLYDNEIITVLSIDDEYSCRILTSKGVWYAINYELRFNTSVIPTDLSTP